MLYVCTPHIIWESWCMESVSESHWPHEHFSSASIVVHLNFWTINKKIGIYRFKALIYFPGRQREEQRQEKKKCAHWANTYSICTWNIEQIIQTIDGCEIFVTTSILIFFFFFVSIQFQFSDSSDSIRTFLHF